MRVASSVTDVVAGGVLELDFRFCILGVMVGYCFGQIASIAWRSGY